MGKEPTVRLLASALRKHTARPEDRNASARNILIYATYLAVEHLGPEEAEHVFRQALAARQ